MKNILTVSSTFYCTKRLGPLCTCSWWNSHRLYCPGHA